jgi:uncharacterized membrane protein YkvA (DUF1232 family)
VILKQRSKKEIVITPEFVTAQSASITQQDAERVVSRSSEIVKKFRENVSLRKFVNESVLFIGLVKDYLTGSYRSIPWWMIAAVVFTLLYVLNPFDLVPEFIPVVGYLDDAAVVSICLSLISQELGTYKNWKEKQRS